MRFGSVCSGIEAASVAWQSLGWKAAWLSEIEPFPCAVLKHHYPDVPNLGDMTLLPERILSGEVEAPDLFCGGTPCQAFSVAGLRNSLDDARGNLSLTFVGIANAIDHVRSVRGDAPAIIFWENVPGVLSTKDNAFGCFLAALAGESDPVTCPDGKWSTAGVVVGQTRTVAWRVLDAQYFGVAQRRRRVFVIASARNDFDPAEILFEFDSVRRDIAPSRETGKVTPTLSSSGTGVSRTGFNCEDEWFVETPVIANTIALRTNDALDVQSGTFIPSKQWPAEIASTLDTHFGDKQGLEDQHVNAGCPMFVPAISPCLETQAGSLRQPCTQAYVVTPPLTASMSSPLGNGEKDAFITAVQPIPINSINALRDADAAASTGCGIGEEGEAMYTLTKGHSHAVAQPIAFSGRMSNPHTDVDIMQTLQAKNPMAVMQPVGTDLYSGNITGDVAATMGTPGSSSNASGPTVMQSMQVRRLTPVECERLQGFPDNYTDIKAKGKPTPDGPRYKALGNSWAVPVVRWIGQRIANEVA